ncbi:MAG TPA: UvrD-helicase domain-containing protein [Candidatus Aquilonibacter sp.]|nr:UvrD-helicase domain-containing protein [Candidatus Aquilonibacter sp.]
MTLLDELNERQREGVLATEGPVLLLAGAGTGKTRVITYRVARLIEQGVPPGAILAVTFTNKAAGVMKERISDLLRASGRDASEVWVSTFHSFCARLLRREARHAGLPRDFAIYDDDDQVAAVKRALAQLDLSSEDFPPRSVRAQISHAKNHGITPDDMEALASDTHDRERKDVARIFRAYNEILQKAAAVDFDDLLLRAVEILRENPQVRQAWSDRFEYLMVDEFQDTNKAQEELVRLLAGARRNVCVVGDEDQSIYGWRGARAGNLKRFTEDFPDAKIIRLEENYRSTQTILDAAAAVVKNNTDRLGKTLRATAGAGERLRFFEAPDSSAEAEYVGGEIAMLARNDPDAHTAVLYRTGAQSRAFEEVLRRLGVRHRVVGGFSFYERAEVRNALAYVRLLFHPEDDVALLRVLNVPPRGIGATTVAALEARARETGTSLWETLGDDAFLEGKRAAGALRYFRGMIEDLREETRALSPAHLIERVLDKSGYLAWIEQEDNLEHTTRAENLRELSNAMAEATEQGQTLEDVLDRAALVADSDEYDESVPVSLMTLHSAKGLEFDSVFLAGLEEGILPHSRSIDTNAEIEEERRLFYVGMTRAKKSLTLSRAVYRRSYGEDRLRASLPSRFLAEVPRDLIEAAAGSQSEPSETRRYEPDPEFGEYSYRRTGAGSGYGQRNYGGYGAGSSGGYGRPSSGRAPAGRAAPGSAKGSGAAARASKDPLIGMRVRHSKYGIGTIIEVEGEGEERKLTVSFQDYGPKKLVERYANLQIA